MFRKKYEETASIREDEDKLINIEAGMQGKLTFTDSVNLRINSTFQGELNTKGTLMIGEKAVINANIKGDIVIIRGEVTGNIKASERLQLSSSAKVTGDIKTPILNMEEGAFLNGNCDVLKKAEVFRRDKGR